MRTDQTTRLPDRAFDDVVVRLPFPAPTTAKAGGARNLCFRHEPADAKHSDRSCRLEQSPNPGSNPERHPGRGAAYKTAVTGRSPERKIGAVAVIAQKNTRGKPTA